MSETKWSPGPWEVDQLGYDPPDFVTSPRGPICLLYSRDTEEPLPPGCHVAENRANAHLIAAAPDLYAELEDAASEMEALADDSAGSETEEYFRLKAERYHHALAKARGEAP